MAERTLVEYAHKFSSFRKTAFLYKTGFRTFSYSYADVYAKSLKVASLLQKLNIKKGDKVIIWAPNSPEWGIFFLGCILNGVIAVPIDIRSDKHFLNRVQKEVKAKLLFQTKFKPKAAKHVIFAEELEDLIVELKAPKLPNVIGSDVVELLYTSGTTASPKGVILTHKNIVSNLHSIKKSITIDSDFVLLSLLPLSHVFEQTIGFFLALTAGATVIYLRTLKPSAIVDVMKEEHVTNMLVVPRILESLQNNILQEISHKKLGIPFQLLLQIATAMPYPFRKYLFWPIHRKLGSLKFFVVGGAPLDINLEKFWNNLGITALQGYGLTETAPVVTCNVLGKRKIGSVGKVLLNQTVKIASDGEILVKGPNITPGYYNDAEKTEASFTKGWFKTGDMGTFDRDGFLFLKGRKKDIIVTSEGLNVYPEDVEAVLNKLPAIHDSCVIGIKGKEGEEVHAVLLTTISKKEAEVLIKNANSKLMQYQQITGYTMWPFEDFPRTPTLKIKKNIVRKHFEKHMTVAVVSKKDKLLNILAKLSPSPASTIKQESLLVKDLKLTSIDRVELISLIEIEFNVDIDETLINTSTTVANLESLIESQKGNKLKQREWVNHFPAKQIRFLFQTFIIFPLLRHYCKLSVEGKENLHAITGPVIFVSNHTSHFDGFIFLLSFPPHYRESIRIAAWGEFYKTLQLPKKYQLMERLFKLLLYNFHSIFGNTYMFEQRTRVLQSLQYSGKLVDRGYNLLVFPEGQRTDTGKMLPFKNGIGLLASELHVPVVPVKISGLWSIFPVGSVWPKHSGAVTLTIGKPIPPNEFKNKSYITIAKQLENAVKAL